MVVAVKQNALTDEQKILTSQTISVCNLFGQGPETVTLLVQGIFQSKGWDPSLVYTAIDWCTAEMQDKS